MSSRIITTDARRRRRRRSPPPRPVYVTLPTALVGATATGESLAKRTINLELVATSAARLRTPTATRYSNFSLRVTYRVRVARLRTRDE